MRFKNLLQSALLLLCVSGSAISVNAGSCGCLTNSISINTGVNPTSGAILAPGNYDPYWTVTTVPASSGLTAPVSAYVIAPYSGWGSSTPALLSTLSANAGWLSPINSATYWINNPAPDSFFEFRYDFCVCQSADYKISGLLGGDDYVDMTVDGATSPIVTGGGWPNIVSFSSTMFLTAGNHYLKLRLRNLGGSVMGVALNGSITSFAGSTLIGQNCCHNVGGITGRKWADVNCNGQVDAGDTVMRNWKITLNPGGISVLTDVTGVYSFPNLAPGTYTVTETNQAGWTPILPNGAGSTTVTVTNGVVSVVDFLNSKCVYAPCDLECYWKTTGNNAISPLNYLGTNNTADLKIKTNSTQRAIIQGTGDGNMGIATAAPSTILHVYAAPPPAGAPSGLRFEKLPAGQGNVLVVDANGYVYVAQGTVAHRDAGGASENVTQLQSQVAQMQQEITSLRSLLMDISSGGNTLSVSPNPTSGQVSATYHIASSYSSAAIKITDNTGKTVLTAPVTGANGTLSLAIPSGAVSGELICVLVVDSKLVATQKLVLLSNR